ncbi:Heterokaryon incompatibility protein 6, OR allele [Madurella mycetomatis]|uniref:Heterokaryon incompatibility protein 6, OR allele n=1 Tax=Madurella mycetomatis TaxID=100816 RepID=A0A175WBF5_9PEZI|nr:Heterokaryon incompatibility protein 6, OR allele [Madurella mycetomatis]
MPATGASAYSPLDKTADEIRLVTIRSSIPGRHLRCGLEKVSLKQLRPEYSVFILSNDLVGKSPRQAQSLWAAPSETSKPEDRFLGSVPEPDRYRFQWGDFAALSYVWGDESIRRDIILNGEVVSITANLEIALRALARDDVFGDRYKLWVDAICINQVDDQERAHQVQKMRDIYSGAWAVISWIGSSRPGAAINYAFRFLRTLASLQGDQRRLENFQTGSGEPSKGTYLCGLNELMKQMYWFRLWVIQEIVMGGSSTVLRFGNEMIDWTTFCRGIGVLYYGSNWYIKNFELERELLSRGVRRGLVWQSFSIHLVHIDLRQLTRSEEETPARRIGFRRLLDISKSAKCREMRDKVFALVGMMDSAVAAGIMEAYEFETPKLFAVVSRVFITHMSNLDPLRQGNPWGRARAPSWAADWTWNGRIRFSRPEYNLVAPPRDPSEPEPDPDLTYRAHGGMPASYVFPDDWRLLECDGFIFDEVAGLGAPEKGFFEWDAKRIVPCPSWRSAYGGFEATGRALWNTLLLSVTAKAERTQERHAALLSLPSTFWAALPQFESRGWDWLAGQRQYYFKWEGWRRAHDDFMLGEQRLGDFFTNTIPEDAEEITYMEVYCSSQRAVMQRRLMLTRKGYFGWGPDNPFDNDPSNEFRVGDKIAILFGCSTPLVIRPRGDKFEVVGEGYVQGFMDGEALRLLESGVCHLQRFTFA